MRICFRITDDVVFWTCFFALEAVAVCIYCSWLDRRDRRRKSEAAYKETNL